MQLFSSHDKLGPQTPIDHHADHLQLLAAIDRTLPARVTATAMHIRLHAAAVTHRYLRHAGPHGHNLDSQLMPRDPRIFKKRHLA